MANSKVMTPCKLSTLRSALSPALATAAVLLAAGCGSTSYEVLGAESAVGADASVEVEPLGGHNAMVILEAEHLAPPERLGSGLKMYVMWLIPDEGGPAQKVSLLEYDEDDREGHARATTMHEKFEVRVTAEKKRTVSTPSEHVVFKQKVQVDLD